MSHTFVLFHCYRLEWLGAKCQLSQLNESLSEPVNNKAREIPSLLLQATAEQPRCLYPKMHGMKENQYDLLRRHAFHQRSVFLMACFE